MKTLKQLLLFQFVAAVLLVLVGCGCDHDIVIDVAVPASCTQSGLAEGQHCALCEEVIVEQVEIPATGHTKVVIEAVAASCTAAGATEGEICAVCNEVLIVSETVPALGHKNMNWKCERCGENLGMFERGYYVDEFRQPTAEGYVATRQLISGTFSNSATTDALLNAEIVADETDVAFFLYEYGRYQVKNPSSYYVDEYQIIIKTSDGTKHTVTGTVYCGGDRVLVDSKYVQNVLDILKSGKRISVYIAEKNNGTTSYLFEVSTSNFAKEYKAMFG